MTKKKPTGRPRKTPKAGKKTMVGVLVSPQLRKKLEAAARTEKRSLTKEAEFRLDQSFKDERKLAEVLEDQLAGQEFSILCQIAALAIKAVQNQTGKKWMEDVETDIEARRAVGIILDAYGFDLPPPDADTIGREAAKIALQWVNMDDETMERLGFS